MTTRPNRFIVTLALAAAAAGVRADDYPNRPIRLVVPLAAAGGMDTIAQIGRAHV